MQVKRGEIFFASLNPVQGSEQGGIRPVLVVQNDVGNQYSPTTIVAAITSQVDKSRLPTHVKIGGAESGLKRDSLVLTEQIRTIDKARLQQKISELSPGAMSRVDQALAVSFHLI